ncbi:hypothetical protein [Lactovum odontotermitis]
MTGEIQHDTDIAAAFTSSVKTTTSSVKTDGGNAEMPRVSWQNACRKKTDFTDRECFS